jgi:hypothetical protein
MTVLHRRPEPTLDDEASGALLAMPLPAKQPFGRARRA